MKEYTITYNTIEKTNLKYKTNADNVASAWASFYEEIENNVFVVSGSAWLQETTKIEKRRAKK